MNIGIDIDGCITDSLAFIVECGTKYFNKEPIDTSKYHVEEIFGVSSDEASAFWINYIKYYRLDRSFRANSVETIRALRNNGNTIYIITSAMNEELVTRSLYEHGVECNKIVFCTTGEKSSYINKYNIDIMIDDYDKNLIEISHNSKKLKLLICFDTPYNQSVRLPNTARAKNWNEIYNIITNIQETL